MTKQELQEQNEQLKATIQKMERRIARLKAKINDPLAFAPPWLRQLAKCGRRGLPWR